MSLHFAEITGNCPLSGFEFSFVTLRLLLGGVFLGGGTTTCATLWEVKLTLLLSLLRFLILNLLLFLLAILLPELFSQRISFNHPGMPDSLIDILGCFV